MFSISLKLFLLSLAIFAQGCTTGSASRMQDDQLTRTEPAEALKGANGTGWRPATFLGLTIGKSTREQLLQTLGKPVSTSDSNAQSDVEKSSTSVETLDVFDYSGEFKGKLQAWSSQKTGVLSGIDIAPLDLSLEDLVRLYGRKYKITRYKFINCPGRQDLGSAPIEESSDGTIEFLEYRQKGIVVSLDHTQTKVLSIEFVDGPMINKCE